MIELLDISQVGVEEKLNKILARSSFSNKEQLETVRQIWDQIRATGDQALLNYTAQFDGAHFKADDLKVTAQEIESAYNQVDDDFLAAIKKSIQNVTSFHAKQLRESWFDLQDDGVMIGQKFEPLSKVGLYVPGGRAAYPSSVVMNGVPAKVAEVEETIMVSPPSASGELNPYTLVAASEVGIDTIYKVGGAQAIAALSLGTETIKQVDKIVGPGNIYVTLAKKIAFGHVDIDMLAGPSEILVLADETANPKFIAADLLSQAEHDPLASAVLITESLEVAEKTKEELAIQLKDLSRQEIARDSLENYGAIIVVRDLEQAINLTNSFAPEHLEVKIADPISILGELKHAGAIFLGEYSAEPLGDYIAGPNHVLPTGGSARFYSPLNIDDFIKKSSIISYSKKALEKVSNHVVKLAEVEGLDAHANSVKVRLKE